MNIIQINPKNFGTLRKKIKYVPIHPSVNLIFFYISIHYCCFSIISNDGELLCVTLSYDEVI